MWDGANTAHAMQVPLRASRLRYPLSSFMAKTNADPGVEDSCTVFPLDIFKPWLSLVGDPRGQVLLWPRAARVGGKAHGPHSRSCPGRGLFSSPEHVLQLPKGLSVPCQCSSRMKPGSCMWEHWSLLALPGMQSCEGGPGRWGHSLLGEGNVICASLGLLPSQEGMKGWDGDWDCGRPVIGSGSVRGLQGCGRYPCR